MFKEPESNGFDPRKLLAAYATVIIAFLGIFGLGFWVLEETGDDWLLMLLCALSGVLALVILHKEAKRN
jgi:hypothetical protein